jgi:hypothetical protein
LLIDEGYFSQIAEGMLNLPKASIYNGMNSATTSTRRCGNYLQQQTISQQRLGPCRTLRTLITAFSAVGVRQDEPANGLH